MFVLVSNVSHDWLRCLACVLQFLRAHLPELMGVLAAATGATERLTPAALRYVFHDQNEGGD
eukprot:COSAG01_NODE_373_length_17991_cov_284.890075_22_plen_62_part_00